MSETQPDREADIIVHHVRDVDSPGGICDRWVVYVGRTKRSDTGDPVGALVFARLLADLNKRRVWVLHTADGRLEPLDPSAVRGCSCC